MTFDPLPAASGSTEPSPVESDAPAAPAAQPEAGAVAAVEPPAGPAGPASLPVQPRRGRFGGFFSHFPHVGFRSRRGRLLAIFIVAAFGAALTVGGVVAVQWTETADFCGRCHTMGPELKAHQISPHRELACAECHVEPGIQGWIKAKINGTKQLIQVLVGNFPKPIPPPGHGDLPPTSATCRRCHDVEALTKAGGPIRLVLRTRYGIDEANTRSNVALVLRPTGFGGDSGTQGVHWHIQSDVEFSSSDPRSQTIDLVRVTKPDGSTEEYISLGKVITPTNVQPDVDHILSTERTSRMDCIDCHNRVGHGVPTLDSALDGALEGGLLDPTLPYLKQQAIEKLTASYGNEDAANLAIEGLRAFYSQQYPLISVTKAGSINGSISALKTIYELVATPEMKVGAATYPDNLGHTNYPGCFRCHDGTHYKVVAGAMTNEKIPSGCATCHTFPQIGENTSSILIGQRPSSHDDKLWVFDHKIQVTSLDPANATCGACHTRTYCENCHNTPAVQVPHDAMVFNHAQVVRDVGAQACVFCHQPAYCERCHAEGILPPAPGASVAPTTLPTTAPTGWPTASP